jgi:hypothetical protein
MLTAKLNDIEHSHYNQIKNIFEENVSAEEFGYIISLVTYKKKNNKENKNYELRITNYELRIIFHYSLFTIHFSLIFADFFL